MNENNTEGNKQQDRRLKISYKEKKMQKKHKHMLAKQHAIKQPMDQQRKQRENEKSLEINGNIKFQNPRDIEK